MKPLTLVLGLAAAALLLLGIVLGFRPVHDAAGNDCGNAFRENPYLADRAGRATCEKERSDALVLPVVLLVAGGVAAVGIPLSRRS